MKRKNSEQQLQVLANELARANTHFYFGKKLLANYQQFGAANDFWNYTLTAHYSIALLNLCRVYDVHKDGVNLFNCLKSIDEKKLDQAKLNQMSVYLAECRRESQNPLVESLRTWRNNIIAHFYFPQLIRASLRRLLQKLYTPISSFHSSGLALMKSRMSWMHVRSCSTSTFTPCERTYSSGP